MNTAIKCIVLLACIICSSTTVMDRCRCVRTINAMNVSLIADVEVINPRPYCNRKEVIAVLKDKTSRCLNPNGEFTQLLVRAMLMRNAARAFKKNTTIPKTTAASAT